MDMFVDKEGRASEQTVVRRSKREVELQGRERTDPGKRTGVKRTDRNFSKTKGKKRKYGEKA